VSASVAGPAALLLLLADFNEPFAGYIKLEQEPINFVETARKLRREIASSDPAAGSEKVHFKTYLPMMLGLKDLRHEDKLIVAFRSFGLDGNGTLDEGEVAQVLDHLGLSLSEVQVADLFREIDTDGAGSIDYKKFMSFAAFAR